MAARPGEGALTGAIDWRWGSRPHVTAVRATVLAIWLVIVTLTPYGYYARFPHGMIAGWGLGRLLLAAPALKEVLFSYPVLVTLKTGAIVTCALALLFPNRCRSLTPVALIFILVLDQLTKSLNGFINHAQLAPLLILLVFALFGGKRYLPSLGFRPELEAAPVERPGAAGAAEGSYLAVLWLASLCLIIPYTFIAINRFLQGGVELFRSDALLDYITLTSRRYSVYGSSFFLSVIQVSWLAAGLKAGYLVTTLFEMTSAGVLFSVIFRRIWLLVIVSFHFLTLFSMNIFFWENLLLITALFGWGAWLRGRAPALRLSEAYPQLSGWGIGYRSNRSSAPM